MCEREKLRIAKSSGFPVAEQQDSRNARGIHVTMFRTGPKRHIPSRLNLGTGLSRLVLSTGRVTT